MKIERLMLALLFLIAMLLSSCTLSASKASASATPRPGLNNTTLLQTIDALSTLSASSAGQSTITPVSPASAGTIIPTAVVITTDTETIEPTLAEMLSTTPAPAQSGGIPVVPITPIATLAYSYSGFAVIHIAMGVDNAAATTNCPPGRNFNFHGDIQTNGPGTITYYWDFSNGTKSSEKMLNFSSTGTQRVSTTWNLGIKGLERSNPFNGWARIYIDFPNHQFFNNQDITLTCK
jgi:hypothetical protein